MHRAGNGRAPSGSEDTGKLHSELEDLQRRFAFVTKVTESNLQKILFSIEGALGSQGAEAGLPVWAKEKSDTLRQLRGLVERAQHDLQFVSTSPTKFFSSEAQYDSESQLVAGVMAGGSQSTAREDEVAKAHQLARVVQERNMMKEKLMYTEERIGELQQKLASVTENHDRLLWKMALPLGTLDMAQMGENSDHIAQHGVSSEAMREAMRQLYDRRIQELEEELISVKKELLHKGAENSGTLSNTCVYSGKHLVREAEKGNRAINSGGTYATNGAQQEETMESLQRKNTFLRNKLVRLKEELQVSQQASVGSAEQLNEGLDALLKKITELQRELVVRERQRADALLAQTEANRKNARLLAQLETMKCKLAQAQAQAGGLSCSPDTARQHDGCNTASAQTKIFMEALEKELKEAQKSAIEYESRTKQLTRSLSAAHALLHTKEAERAKLLLELEEARGIYEVAQAQLDHFIAEGDSIAKIEAHLKKTVEALLHPDLGEGVESQRIDGDGGNNNTVGVLQHRLDAILQHLASLEASDLELRQRGDEIVILKDEKSALSEQNEHLQRTLSNFSLLFRSMPQTPAEVEHLVLERDLFFSALQRCQRLSEVPNVRETLRDVELRKIELDARRVKHREHQLEEGKPSDSDRLPAEHRDLNIPSSPRCGSSLPSSAHALRLLGYRFPERSPSLEVMEERGEEYLSSPRLRHSRPGGDATFFSSKTKASCA